MKHIFTVENGQIEFETEEEMVRWLTGEKIELTKIGENLYKASFPNPLDK